MTERQAEREPSKAAVRRAETAAGEVRKRLRLARRIRAWTAKQPGGYGSDLAESVRKRFGLSNTDDARKLPLLVDENRGFRETDIEQLLDLAVSRGYAVGVTKLKRLLAVPAAEDRLTLARRMVENGWSQAETEAEIREANGGAGRQQAGGRPPRVPDSATQLVDEFAKLATRWKRLHTTAKDAPAWLELSRRQQKAIRDVSAAMGAAGLQNSR